MLFHSFQILKNLGVNHRGTCNGLSEDLTAAGPPAHRTNEPQAISDQQRPEEIQARKRETVIDSEQRAGRLGGDVNRQVVYDDAALEKLVDRYGSLQAAFLPSCESPNTLSAIPMGSFSIPPCLSSQYDMKLLDPGLLTFLLKTFWQGGDHEKDSIKNLLQRKSFTNLF